MENIDKSLLDQLSTRLVQAQQSFPWFATDLIADKDLIEISVQGQSVLDALAYYFDVDKKVIQASRYYQFNHAAVSHLSKKELLSLMAKLPTDYLPKESNINDQKVFFEYLEPICDLAKFLDVSPQKLATDFTKGWQLGLEKLKMKLGNELSFNHIYEMMRASYHYGVYYPILKPNHSDIKQPTGEWLNLWFGHYGLSRLFYLADKWQNSVSELYKSHYNDDVMWDSVIDNTVVDGYTIVELNSAEKLEFEGQELDFCVGSYTKRCLLKNSFIFSIKDKNWQSVSTFEVIFADKKFKLNQHFSFKNSTPDYDQQNVANEFVEKKLSEITLNTINKVQTSKIELGNKVKEQLVSIDTNETKFDSSQLKVLQELVRFTNPAETKKNDVHDFLINKLPKLLISPKAGVLNSAKRIRTIGSKGEFSIGENSFTWHTKANKYNGKIICFIRIKDSRYRSSYCGAVDPLSTTFYYRTTNKSPDDSKSKKIHKDLEGLFNNFTKKYQAYKREDRMVAEF